MTSDMLIPALFIITLVAALAFGAYQWRKASKARKEHKHSSVGDLRETPNSKLPPAPRVRGDRI